MMCRQLLPSAISLHVQKFLSDSLQSSVINYQILMLRSSLHQYWLNPNSRSSSVKILLTVPRRCNYFNSCLFLFYLTLLMSSTVNHFLLKTILMIIYRRKSRSVNYPVQVMSFISLSRTVNTILSFGVIIGILNCAFMNC